MSSYSQCICEAFRQCISYKFFFFELKYSIIF